MNHDLIVPALEGGIPVLAGLVLMLLARLVPAKPHSRAPDMTPRIVVSSTVSDSLDHC